MAAAPWSENAYKVVVDFKKSSGGAGHRAIKLSHTGSAVPPQLAGRISPDAWRGFMEDIERLAATHPYVVRPSAGKVAGWAGAALVGSVLGFCCLDPDGGDYGNWVPQAQSVLANWAPTFASAGARPSLQRAQGGYWVQIDVDPAFSGKPV